MVLFPFTAADGAASRASAPELLGFSAWFCVPGCGSRLKLGKLAKYHFLESNTSVCTLCDRCGSGAKDEYFWPCFTWGFSPPIRPFRFTSENIFYSGPCTPLNLKRGATLQEPARRLLEPAKIWPTPQRYKVEGLCLVPAPFRIVSRHQSTSLSTDKHR